MPRNRRENCCFDPGLNNENQLPQLFQFSHFILASPLDVFRMLRFGSAVKCRGCILPGEGMAGWDDILFVSSGRRAQADTSLIAIFETMKRLQKTTIVMETPLG